MPFVSRTSWGVTMAGQDYGLREHVPEPMQDFIFQRELSEVYLLLDYLSGRSNQSLATALADEKGGKVAARGVAQNRWPPGAIKPQQTNPSRKTVAGQGQAEYGGKTGERRLY